MAKIIISELDINVDNLLKSTQEVKTAIDKLKVEQKELSKNGQTSSEQFIKNSADLKVLSSAYNQNIKALADNSTALQTNEQKTIALNLALEKEATSIDEARKQNALLSKIRNETNATTDEGRKTIDALNKKLNENNEFIKENADASLKLKMNIGNYSESVKEALSNINPLNGGLAGFSQRAQEAGGVGNLLKTSLEGATQGIFGMIKASLAFIATPLGLVLTAVAGAVTTLYNVFKSFTPIVDKVEQVFAGISATLSVVKNTIIGLVTGAKSLGSAFSGLAGSMKEAYQSAERLKKAQQDLEDAMAEQEVTSAKNRVEINKLNIQSKDLTKTNEERLELLKKAEDLEKKDFAQRKKNSDEQLRQAYEAIRIEAELTDAEFAELKKRGLNFKEYTETKSTGQDKLFEKLKESLLAQTSIENEYYSNIEKNILKQNKVIEKQEEDKAKAKEDAIKREQELEQKRQTILDNSLSKSQSELNNFLSKQGVKVKSYEDELLLADKVYQKQLEINKKEFEASKKTAIDKLNLDTANNEAKNTLLQKQSEIAIAIAQRELNLYIENNKSKIDANKFLTDEIVADEVKRNESIANERRNFELIRLQEGAISQQQYNDAINSINKDNQLKNDELKLQRKEAEKEKQLIDLENKRLEDNANFQLKLETDLQRLEIERLNELKNAEKTGADKELINKKYQANKLKLIQLSKESELQLASQTLNALRGLLKENTVVAKTLAVAEATINTYLGATKALATIPPPYGQIMAGITIASGLGQVAKITGVQFEKGGIQEVGGNRHYAGGTKFYGEDGTIFEAEAGEGIGVLSRNAFSSFLDFNNRFGGGKSTSTFMQGGGILTQSVKSSSIDVNELANLTLEAVRNLPPIQVAVEDINRGQQSYVEVVSKTNF